MTPIEKAITETNVKKYIPYFIIGKLVIFIIFLIYMMQL